MVLVLELRPHVSVLVLHVQVGSWSRSCGLYSLALVSVLHKMVLKLSRHELFCLHVLLYLLFKYICNHIKILACSNNSDTLSVKQ